MDGRAQPAGELTRRGVIDLESAGRGWVAIGAVVEFGEGWLLPVTEKSGSGATGSYDVTGLVLWFPEAAGPMREIGELEIEAYGTAGATSFGWSSAAMVVTAGSRGPTVRSFEVWTSNLGDPTSWLPEVAVSSASSLTRSKSEANCPPSPPSDTVLVYGRECTPGTVGRAFLDSSGKSAT